MSKHCPVKSVCSPSCGFSDSLWDCTFHPQTLCSGGSVRGSLQVSLCAALSKFAKPDPAGDEKRGIRSSELSSSSPSSHAGCPGSPGCDKGDAHSGNSPQPKPGTWMGISQGNVEDTKEASIPSFRAAAHWEGDKTRLQTHQSSC